MNKYLCLLLLCFAFGAHAQKSSCPADFQDLFPKETLQKQQLITELDEINKLFPLEEQNKKTPDNQIEALAQKQQQEYLKAHLKSDKQKDPSSTQTSIQ